MNSFILALRTDGPVCEMYLYDSFELKAKTSWEAGRGLALGLLSHLEAFLLKNNATWQDLSGLVVFRGPGSFTGLRIGVTVMNTLAGSLGIPIVGTDRATWKAKGLAKLEQTINQRIILPIYSSDPHIATPKK